MLFSYVSGQQQIGNNKKCRQIAGNFDCHADVAVWPRAHLPIEHIQGFTWSHWMPPLASGECLCHIAPAAAMVDGFVEKTLNTKKKQLLHSKYGAFRSLVVSENFNPKTDPLLSSSMWQALFKCGKPWLELKSSIKRCQGTKSEKIIKLARSSLIKVAHICANRGIPVKQHCTHMGFNNVELMN
jgi:hypothetical protein